MGKYRIARSKDYSKLIRRLLKEGWTIEPGKGHGKLRSPKGRLVVFSQSAVSRSGYRNLEALVSSIQREEQEK